MNETASTVLVCAVEGTALTPAEQDFYARVAPSGVTLFTRNVPETQSELTQLVRALQATRPAGAPPLVIAIDQEGGRVRRLKAPFGDAGPAMGLAGGRSDPIALTSIRAVAEDLGHRLLRLGVNVDFAPVCDVLTEPTNTAIGDRAFGTEAEPAALRAQAFLRGLQESGVLGCLKHFPGQGDAKVDTHLGAAVIDLPLELLHERELAPFRALLPDAEMVMISHCIYPALAPEEASRSPRIMQGLLRAEMGFRGVIVSDDMNMGAIPQDSAAWTDAIVHAVAAGADMLLVCRDIDKCWKAYERLKAEAAKSAAFAARLQDAAERVMRLRKMLPLSPKH